MNIRDKYLVECDFWRDPIQEGAWGQLKCRIIQVTESGEKTQVGKFLRNYASLYNTWEPFEQNGQEYALCSPDYMATSVMKLPECKVIAVDWEPGDEYDKHFCPSGFYVPQYMRDYFGDNEPEEIPEEVRGRFGIVCGCRWGDDTSWKVESLDLSNIERGELKRSNRFGYVELPGPGEDLRRHTRVTDYDSGYLSVTIDVATRHNVYLGEK